MTAVPLTPAEQIAAQELFRLSESGGEYHAPHWTVEDFADEARAVVAAVRNLIEAEALTDMADRFEAYGTFGGEKAWPFVADLRMAAAARQSLSRPTPEDQQ